MKHSKSIAVAVILTLTVIATTGKAHAQPVTKVESSNTIKSILGIDKDQSSTIKLLTALQPPKEEEVKPSPKPLEYIAVEGDSLVKIAQTHNITWQRLWQKNTQLINQDQLKVGDKIIIPLTDEQLAERPLIAQPINIPTQAQKPVIPTQKRSYASSGNSYDAGYCTYYAKNRRPDLPNNLGDARSWYGNAQAQGIPTGSIPKAGAIGVSFKGYYGHVVYVESVNGSTITISEMNYRSWNVISSRTANANEFVYIY